MKPTQKELTEWAINQIQTKYKDDVALLTAISGHALEDDCHGECFDYFIPATDRGYQLAQTFIIDGVGHDLYPRSWERMENMANLDDNFTWGLAGAQILYARSDADRERFTALQEKLKANLQNKDFMLKKALENLDAAMDIYRTMVFEDSLYKVRMAAGYIAHYLSTAVVYLNGTFIRNRRVLETAELSHMKELPDGFIEDYHAIVRAKMAEELKQLCYEIIRTTRTTLASHKQSKHEKTSAPNYQNLADWYQEASLWWRRIYYHCDMQDSQSVFPDAILLQNELGIIQAEYGLREMDLLGCYDAENLSALKQRAQQWEQYIRSEIQCHGVIINQYDTLEQFLAKNQ